MEYQTTMWAELNPDLYGGEACDEVIPRWQTFEVGGMDSEFQTVPLELAPSTFPPGTKITIEEPCCPDCEEPWTPSLEGEFESECDCGFHWGNWVSGKYA